MSIALVTAAFKAELASTPKFVLVALCDIANDQGECFPGVPLLMARCGMGERTVQGALNAIEKAGYLKREFRTGRATLYSVTPPASWPTPAAAAPPQQMPTAADAPPQDMRGTPADVAPTPPQILRDTPAAAAPITVNEPSIPKEKKKTASPLVVSVDVLVAVGFDEATAGEFIAYKAGRKAPLTARAWADHMRESQKAGWTPLAAAEKVMAKHWRGFEASYVAGEQQARASPARESFREADERRARERWSEVLGRPNKPQAATVEVFDVAAKRIA